jgi:nucleoid-associated protein YgaU
VESGRRKGEKQRRTSQREKGAWQMDQGVRIAAAVGVLLGGVFVAMLFRHDPPQEGLPTAESGDQLMLRKRSELPCGPPTTAERGEEQTLLAPLTPPVSPTPSLPDSATTRRTPTVLRPRDGNQSPPGLPTDYPGDTAYSEGTAPLAGELNTSAGEKQARTHKVVDGDTLRLLAERYLGSGEAAPAIYDANRNLLSRPEILPIGVELIIPPREATAATPSYMPARPLVPVTNESDAKRQKPRRKS